MFIGAPLADVAGASASPSAQAVSLGQADPSDLDAYGNELVKRDPLVGLYQEKYYKAFDALQDRHGDKEVEHYSAMKSWSGPFRRQAVREDREALRKEWPSPHDMSVSDILKIARRMGLGD